MRTRARVDKNQAAIVATLRGVGASVQPLHQLGRGCPDLLVCFRGVHYLLEVKDGDEPLTPMERVWHATWRGPVAVVRSAEEALALVGATVAAS